MTFIHNLINNLILNIDKNYNNNYDYLRFGNKLEKSSKGIKQVIIQKLREKGYINLSQIKNFILQNIQNLDLHLNDIEHFYNKLEDERSKNLLVNLVLYRILGEKKVVLIDNLDEYWEKIRNIESAKNESDFIQLNFKNWKIFKFDLNELFNIPLKLYHTVLGICVVFHLKQYDFHSNGFSIQVENGDHVIDAGACRGETSLKFAHKAGPDGKVFSFEFVDSNIKIFKKNIELNPHLANRIKIIENPIWDASNKKVYIIDHGPGSKVSFDELANADIKNSVSIDDIVENHKIEKIDFIKMDIEGAELPALKGAIITINKFKPKMAISIYHSLEDFTRIYRWIDDLQLGYKFYLGHYTIHLEETILYASI